MAAPREQSLGRCAQQRHDRKDQIEWSQRIPQRSIGSGIKPTVASTRDAASCRG